MSSKNFTGAFVARMASTAQFAGAAAALALFASLASAQCPADDATTTNNDCGNAAAGSIGLTSGLSVQGGVEDFWTYLIPSGSTLSIDVLFLHADGDVDITLYGDPGVGGCTGTLDSGGSSTNNESVSYTYNGGGTGSVALRVFRFNNPAGTCVNYSIDASLMTDPCASDDGEEENDTCATAVVPSANNLTGLVVKLTDEDYYSYSVAAGETINASVSFSTSSADIDAQLIDGGDCTTVLDDADFNFSSPENLTYSNATGVTQTVILRAYIEPGDPDPCNVYDLDVEVLSCTDDAFEPNNDCMSAVAIMPGSFPGLTIQQGSNDYFSITIMDGEQISIDLTFLDADGDIDLALYDAAGCDLFASRVANSGSSTDNESVAYLNGTGSDQDLIVRNRRFGTEFCTPYAMDITVAVPPCEDDDMMTNDDCASADSISEGSTLATVIDISDDWYTISVPDGFTLCIDVNFTHADGDIDVGLEAPCGTIVDDSKSVTDSESVSWANSTGGPVDASLAVYLYMFTASTCNDYEVVVALKETACLLAVDDADEENDTCLAAVTPSANPLVGAFVSKSDPDYYGPFTLMDSEQIDVLVSHLHANGDIDAQLLDASDCTTVLDSSGSSSDDEDLTFLNLSGSAVSVVVRVYVFSGSSSDCDNYDLSTAISLFVDPCDPMNDDAFEDNDDCMTAASITPGSYPGLFVQKPSIDEDWYSILVPNSATIDIEVAHLNATGDIDAGLFTECGTQVDSSTLTGDLETLSWFNNTGVRQTVRIRVFVWSGDSDFDCNNYDLDIDINGGSGTDFVDFCFGDGSGTACPCGNNAATGSGGGCRNSNSGSAILAASGTSSILADDLQFSMSDAAPISFALLTAGINKLNGGMGLMENDGLRCVGGELVRLEVRATDAMGNTVSNWGSGDSIQTQYANAAAASVGINPLMAGQTRHFQAVYRDAVAVAKAEGSVAGAPDGCGTGLNRTQAISVTFLP